MWTGGTTRTGKFCTSGNRRKRTCDDRGQSGAVDSFRYRFRGGSGGETWGPLHAETPTHFSTSPCTTKTRGAPLFVLFNNLLCNSRGSNNGGRKHQLPILSCEIFSYLRVETFLRELRRRTNGSLIWTTPGRRRLQIFSTELSNDDEDDDERKRCWSGRSERRHPFEWE